MLNTIPGKYAQSAVASSQGLLGNGRDVWHFRPSSMRELGKRYARAILKLSDNTFIARKGGSVGIAPKAVQANALIPFASGSDAKIFTLDGKQKASGNSDGQDVNAGNVYLIKGSNGSKLEVLGAYPDPAK